MIIKKEFDSLIFDLDYYRIENFDRLDILESEFQSLTSQHMIIDAKVDSSNI